MQKASLVKGTRDFGPVEVAKRNHIFETIRTVFKSYGFAPIETPSLEKTETLTGKYGDEGDQLLFHILNNGDILSKANTESSQALKKSVSDKGLRYDLTVPFARFTAMNRHAIKMPFKRYQMQAVWRADRPQKGRYREFWQCDADTIGTNSLVCEVECIEMFDKVFSALGLPVTIHLNHRKLLEAIAHQLGFKNNFTAFSVAIDKLDKIGMDGVLKELQSKAMDTSILEGNPTLLSAENFDTDEIENCNSIFNSDLAKTAIGELSEILNYLGNLNNAVLLDKALARGLSYYTGCIFEVKLKNQNYGSVAAGGRYDNLTEVFGVKDISGIGISFGADRIYDILEELNLFPEDTTKLADVLVCPMDKEAMSYALQIASNIRSSSKLATIVYPKAAKLKKQLDYANAIGASYALVLGSEEMENKSISLKNLTTGEQEIVKAGEITGHLK